MRAHVRFVGLLMVIVLLVAVVAAAGPVTYIVTVDEYGNSYYLESPGEGTLLGPQTSIGNIATYYNHGAGIGEFTDDGFYDFVVGSGFTGGPEKEIYLYERSNNGNDFLGPDQVGTWSTGDLPGEMAVAKFSGKVFDVGVLDDFVMVRWGSQNAGLYRMGADGKFVESLLTGVAPQYSYGADAADINHDGYADFVVAPVEGDPQIYVNLANGDGTFTTQTFYTYGYPQYPTWYTGITAADFDGDYKVDLIATVAGSGGSGLDFYKGDGLGGFTWRDRVGSGLSGESPVDNYDLDNDGDQDLVASNLFNIDSSGVIVYLNDGFGYFTAESNTIYFGDQHGVHTVIAAPPVFQNQPPLADLSVSPALPPDDSRIAQGTILAFSGAGSEDPEGMPLEYSWQFADDGTDGTPVTTQDATHTFNTPGLIDVTLTVTDNYGETATQTVTINVNHPPVANDDWYDAIVNTPLSVSTELGILANDTDADGDLPLTLVNVGDPAHGTLLLNADGSFTYTPETDFTGPTDSFTYQVNDGLNDSNVATVTIDYNAPMTWKVNIAPDIINLKSKGTFIAFITLPKMYSVNDVVVESIACQGASGILLTTPKRPMRQFRHSKFPQTFGVMFRTADLEGVQVGKKVQFTVIGQVKSSDGQILDFSGSDTVRVISLNTKARDETEDWWQHSDKKLFDDHFKGNNDKDNKDNRDNR